MLNALFTLITQCTFQDRQIQTLLLKYCNGAGGSKREVGGNVSASHFLVGNGNMESQPYSGLTCTGEVAASPKAADFLVF